MGENGARKAREFKEEEELKEAAVKENILNK